MVVAWVSRIMASDQTEKSTKAEAARIVKAYASSAMLAGEPGVRGAWGQVSHFPSPALPSTSALAIRCLTREIDSYQQRLITPNPATSLGRY